MPSASRLAVVLASLSVLAMALSGCAGQSFRRSTTIYPTLNLPPSSTPSPSRAPVGASSLVPPGRLLIQFQRVTGYDPWSSGLSVNRHGAAVAIETDGGVGGQHRRAFTLTPTALRRLRRLIDRAHLHDTWCCSARSYIYVIDIDDHDWRLQQGRVHASTKLLIADLNAILSAHTI